jgi:hypothetical protein
LNTAQTKEALLEDAEYFKPRFLRLIEEGILSQNPSVTFASGPNNRDLMKSESGFDFKLQYRKPNQVPDMLRTTILCPSITIMEEAIRKFTEYLQSQQLDYGVVNFYNNILKFGSLDREEGGFTAYVGYHMRIYLEEKEELVAPPTTIVADTITTNLLTTDVAEEHLKKKARFDSAEEKQEAPHNVSTIVEEKISSSTVDPQVTAAAAPPPPSIAESAIAESVVTPPHRLAVEIQFHPTSLYDGTDECIKSLTHSAYRAWHTREARATPELQETTRKSLEMYFAFAMMQCPS